MSSQLRLYVHRWGYEFIIGSLKYESERGVDEKIGVSYSYHTNDLGS